jgi:hypothetical protein
MPERKISKKKKKKHTYIRGKKPLDTRIKGDENHGGHGMPVYEVRGNEPKLMHGDGAL